MATWFYYNELGEKIAISGKELKALAERGAITPGTLIESPDGKAVPARQVKGLTFAVSIQPVETENPFTAPMPVLAKSTENVSITAIPSWITFVGFWLLIAVVWFIVAMPSGEDKNRRESVNIFDRNRDRNVERPVQRNIDSDTTRRIIEGLQKSLEK